MNSSTVVASGRPLRVLIVGCGAVVEEYQGPAAQEAQRMGLIEVVGLVDANEDRLVRCGRMFPSAKCATSLEDARDADLALIATPARSHPALALELMRRGHHLLIEKPVCASVHEVRQMQAEADRLGRTLAVGHFRRFFPAIETVRSIIESGVFGKVRRVVADEGAMFRWPTASDAFFVREKGGGGVTLDVGIHMLEILVSWLGMPEISDYADDAMGGVEINSAARLQWSGGAQAEIRLSWDVDLANRYRIEFERATVTWRCGQATDLLIEMAGVAAPLHSSCRLANGEHVEHSLPAYGYLGAFTAQWKDVAEAIVQKRAPRVGIETAGAALSLVEAMYGRKRLMDMPHLEAAEQVRAQQLLGVV